MLTKPFINPTTWDLIDPGIPDPGKGAAEPTPKATPPAEKAQISPEPLKEADTAAAAPVSPSTAESGRAPAGKDTGKAPERAAEEKLGVDQLLEGAVPGDVVERSDLDTPAVSERAAEDKIGVDEWMEGAVPAAVVEPSDLDKSAAAAPTPPTAPDKSAASEQADTTSAASVPTPGNAAMDTVPPSADSAAVQQQQQIGEVQDYLEARLEEAKALARWVMTTAITLQTRTLSRR